MKKKIATALAALLLAISVIASSPALAAEEAPSTYLLLNVEADGVFSVRDLVFTNLETGEEVWFRDLLGLGRAGSRQYLMQSLPAGEYILSRIYPTVNGNDNAPSIEAGERDGVITILADTINYIGDFILESRERGRGVRSSFNYEPNSNTLIAAVTAERELFETLDVAISIAGNPPIAVDKQLLGL
ncbi:MAG: hypothetical protein DHS20C12_23720 [Pseudohongiella sp.]|nr:MAG: hypothetical protein DHS20C12_23720 [Pseudohongiella sp.]